MLPRISIITAVYNRRETVREAVLSVQMQTYPHVEHVIVDGGSTDGTLDVLRACLGPNASLVSERDNGIYDALNKGLAICSGEVVGVMHSDDYFSDDTVLADVATAFESHDVDAVYGDLDYVETEDTSNVVRHWRAGSFWPGRLDWGWMPPHPTLFLKRNLIERLGGYDTRYRISADYDLVLRYFGSNGIRSSYLPRVLVKMRTGGASNESLSRILRKSWEDWLSIRQHGVGHIGGLGALAGKNFGKLSQFAPMARRFPRGFRTRPAP